MPGRIFLELAQVRFLVVGEEARKLMVVRRMEVVQRMGEGRIDLHTVSDYPLMTACIRTAHARPRSLLITLKITRSLSSLPMRIKPIFPLPHLPDLLIAVPVLIITTRSRRVVYIIPVLRNCVFLAVLLPAFAAPPLALLSAGIEAIYIVVFPCDSPVRQCAFRRGSRWRGGSSLLGGIGIDRRSTRPWEPGLWLALLR